MIGASIFLIFISTTKSNNPTITRIIAVVGVIAIALLSIAKVTRKQLSPAEVCKYFGVLGIIGSVTMAGMFSVAISTSYQSSINIFLIAQVVVIALMEFKHSKKLEYKKIQKNIVTTSMFVPFAVLGSRLAKYLDSSDMKIVVLLLMFLLWVAYISFHLWFIKYRKMSK